VSPEILEKLESPRQILKKLYVFDGAYYLTSINHILDKQSLISDETRLFSRTGWGTLNIDNAEDLELANYLAIKFHI
jgi:CMP-N-acetylneuraminic acid synthetase